MYWRGNNKRKSQWSMRWLGPGIVIGHEGRANVWISHRNTVVKAAGNHVRLAEVEEQLPWHDLYDSFRDTDEETYFDLCPPGVSRDPQYGGPSTSSDAPMTPQRSWSSCESCRMWIYGWSANGCQCEHHIRDQNLKKMMNQTIDGNSGHCESEIELTGLQSLGDKPRMD